MILLLSGRADRPIVDRLQEPGSLADVHGRPRAIQLRDLSAEMLLQAVGPSNKGGRHKPTAVTSTLIPAKWRSEYCWTQSFGRPSAHESERGVLSDTRPT
jgi:hypothetical protein